MLEMARKQLLPAVNSYMSELANTAASKLAVSENISVRSETKTLTKLSADADAMSDAVDTLQDAVDASKALPTEAEKGRCFPRQRAACNGCSACRCGRRRDHLR